ncbi:MAG: hypothetical protein A2Z72_03505 [Omnitrophica bacterium RBG_13_46_9]|nr:MAG: hypothetical protein A2Z72_03505 [Omnitrophica bacterium RBG_13_46_9]
MTYKVQLPIFEGPLDLLLYLIKKEEINIYDIPISKITDQYLDYLEVMKLLDLDIAGEFILMAATLMHIKSRMLLPIESTEEDMAEEADPREELVRKLIEYKRFKEAASDLKGMQLRQRDTFSRLNVMQDPQLVDEKPYFEASLFDLITAFSKVLKEIPKEVFYQVVRDEFTVSEKIHEILHILVDKTTIYFSQLFYTEGVPGSGGKIAKSKNEIIAIFMALLELVKLKEVVIRQSAPFCEIEVLKNPEWQRG